MIQLLKRIAGDNYAIVYDGHNVTALHVLPQGIDQSVDSVVSIPEFSGLVKISNRRAKMFFMPADNSKEAVDRYIESRHRILAKLSEEEPNRELQAQISFQGYLSSDQIISLVKQNQIDPVTLNIGWKENGGGYDLKHGESIEEAITSSKLHHERFISQLREDADMLVASLREQGVNESQMQSELAFQENSNELSYVFKANGVPFYGMRVTARAKQLHAITSDEKIIRLVDPLWAGLVEDEISGVYPLKKIAIPIIPEREDFIP